MNIAYKFPEAFRRGQEDCLRHYARVDAGEIGEQEDLPEHPYQRLEGRIESEWQAYNAGWYSAIPYEPELLNPEKAVR